MEFVYQFITVKAKRFSNKKVLTLQFANISLYMLIIILHALTVNLLCNLYSDWHQSSKMGAFPDSCHYLKLVAHCFQQL